MGSVDKKSYSKKVVCWVFTGVSSDDADETYSPPHITDQNVNKVGAANAPFIFSPQYIWKYDRYPVGLARAVEVLLCLTDGSIPAPPFDLVMARAERCTFRYKSGVLDTPL